MRPLTSKVVIVDPNLLQGQEKMSKSDPNSAIFMEDTEAEVNSKIKKTFCPPGVVVGNPVITYIQHIVLPWCHQVIVERKEAAGGNKCVEPWTWKPRPCIV